MNETQAKTFMFFMAGLLFLALIIKMFRKNKDGKGNMQINHVFSLDDSFSDEAGETAETLFGVFTNQEQEG